MKLHEIADKKRDLINQLTHIEQEFHEAFSVKILAELKKHRPTVEKELQHAFTNIAEGNLRTFQTNRAHLNRVFDYFEEALESEYIPKAPIKLEEDDDDVDGELEDDDIEPPLEDDL